MNNEHEEMAKAADFLGVSVTGNEKMLKSFLKKVEKARKEVCDVQIKKELSEQGKCFPGMLEDEIFKKNKNRAEHDKKVKEQLFKKMLEDMNAEVPQKAIDICFKSGERLTVKYSSEYGNKLLFDELIRYFSGKKHSLVEGNGFLCLDCNKKNNAMVFARPENIERVIALSHDKPFTPSFNVKEIVDPADDTGCADGYAYDEE